MEYDINPCLACRKHYDALDINNIKDCVFNTCAAFSGASSSDQFVGSPCYKSALACIKDTKELMGKNVCEFRVYNPPVLTQNHFFPNLMKEVGNKGVALKKCIEMCDDTNLPNECKRHCQVDHDAVVMKKETKKDKLSTTSTASDKTLKNDKHIIGYILLGVVGVIMLVFIILVVMKKI